MIFGRRILAIVLSVSTLTNALPLEIAPKPRALVARASYSVVNVDGGSSAAPDATSVQQTKTATETVKVTEAVSTVTDKVTATIVKTTATPSPASSTAKTSSASSSTPTPSSASSSPVPASTSKPPSSSTTPTPIANTSVLTVTVTEPAGPTEWYDNGMWHTSYRVKTFWKEEVATATSSVASSLPTLEPSFAQSYNQSHGHP